MYSVVEIAGHQYRVNAGDLLDVDRLQAEEGAELKLEDVLFVGGDEALVGSPKVNGAYVLVRVLRHDRDRKVLLMKRAPGKWKKRRGFRTHYTALEILELADGKGNVAKAEAKADKTEAKTEKKAKPVKKEAAPKKAAAKKEKTVKTKKEN